MNSKRFNNKNIEENKEENKNNSIEKNISHLMTADTKIKTNPVIMAQHDFYPKNNGGRENLRGKTFSYIFRNTRRQ